MTEHQCPRCHREVKLPLGENCGECRAAIEGRARKLGWLVAGGSTVVVGLYVVLRMPDDPTARLVGGMAVAIWFLLTNMVVRRAARELLR